MYSASGSTDYNDEGIYDMKFMLAHYFLGRKEAVSGETNLQNSGVYEAAKKLFQEKKEIIKYENGHGIQTNKEHKFNTTENAIEKLLMMPNQPYAVNLMLEIGDNDAITNIYECQILYQSKSLNPYCQGKYEFTTQNIQHPNQTVNQDLMENSPEIKIQIKRLLKPDEIDSLLNIIKEIVASSGWDNMLPNNPTFLGSNSPTIIEDMRKIINGKGTNPEKQLYEIINLAEAELKKINTAFNLDLSCFIKHIAQKDIKELQQFKHDFKKTLAPEVPDLTQTMSKIIPH